VDIFEALLNLSDVFADLWPLDDSPRVLMQVLLHYNMAAGYKASEADRAKFMTDFCDAVLRENVCRAVERDTPLSFREAKERWTELAERANMVAAPNQVGGGGHQGGNNGPTAATGPGKHSQRKDGLSDGNRMGGGQKGGMAMRSRTCRFLSGGQSWPVCFQYNRGGCKRTTKGAGCDDGRSGIFAHVCNFWDSQANKYCLATHPRDKNH